MISQTTDYALRAMMLLASQDGDPVSRETIASSAGVPFGYLAKIMRDMVLARLVVSFRGPHGGFVLARDPADITIFDVVSAVDPIQRINRCPIGDPSHMGLCALHRRLDRALADIEEAFRATTLAELLTTDSSRPRCKPPERREGATPSARLASGRLRPPQARQPPGATFVPLSVRPPAFDKPDPNAGGNAD